VNGEESTHVQGSGSESEWLVGLVRSAWPVHRVSRGDACQDWSHAKAWRWVSKLALRVAAERKIATSTVGDWVTARDGRTLYLGAPSSYVRARVYEKGKQLGADPHWVRLEIQVRPAGQGKYALSTAEPAQLMECAQWTRDLARAIGLPELEAVRVRDPWTPTDDERSLSWCLQQYGALFERRAQQLGGWDRFGESLGAELQQKRFRQH
jgi:hypothetical protein